MELNLDVIKCLVKAAVLASLDEQAVLRKLLRSISFSRISTRKITETLLEIHLFVGFPAAIEFSSLALVRLRENSSQLPFWRPRAGAVNSNRISVVS